MKNLYKHNNTIDKFLKDRNLTTVIFVYMSTKVGGDDYDPYEDNKTYTNLNKIAVRGLVRDLTGETAYYKAYGVHYSGIKEIICEKRWKTAFEKCNKITIDDIEYQTMKDAGNKMAIVDRPFNIIRVTISRK